MPEAKYDSFYGGWFGNSRGGSGATRPGDVPPGGVPDHDEPDFSAPSGSSGRNDFTNQGLPGNVTRNPPLPGYGGNLPGGEGMVRGIAPWLAAIAAALVPGDGLFGSIEAGKAAYGWTKDKMGNWQYGQNEGIMAPDSPDFVQPGGQPPDTSGGIMDPESDDFIDWRQPGFESGATGKAGELANGLWWARDPSKEFQSDLADVGAGNWEQGGWQRRTGQHN